MGRQLNTEEFIEKATDIHGTKYNYDSVDYKRWDIKIDIYCPIHNKIFKQTPNSHLGGQGCPACGRISRVLSSVKDPQQFIEESKLIHDDKYDYRETEYIRSNRKVKIICLDHGEFLQTPSCHLSGQGCPKCGDIKISEKTKHTIDNFLEKAYKKHGNKFDYSLVEFKDYNTKIKIICPLHGEKIVHPRNHLNSKGCKECTGMHKSAMYRSNTAEFIKKAKKVHGSTYSYNKVNYVKNSQNIEIYCKVHEEYFQQSPANHLLGKGCQKCGLNNYSKSENKWLDSLDINTFERQYKVYHDNGYYEVDGYDPITNTIYEFLGDFWHGNFSNPNYQPDKINTINKKTFSQLYIKTVQRFNELQRFGYTVKFVWERDYKKDIMFSNEL